MCVSFFSKQHAVHKLSPNSLIFTNKVVWVPGSNASNCEGLHNAYSDQIFATYGQRMVNHKLLKSDTMNFNNSKIRKNNLFVPRSLLSMVSTVPSNSVMLV